MLKIYGSDFSSDPNNITPIFSTSGSKSKIPGEVISASENQLKVKIPDQATPGTFFVDVKGRWSNQVQLGSASVQAANTTEESTSSINNDSGGIPWFGMIPWLLTGGFPPQNDPPNAVISADPISGEAPLEVSFDGSDSSDPDGDDLSYTWDFGDGASANGQNATHEFDTEGNYTIQLTVKDGRDGEDDATTAIYVTAETVTETIDSSGGTVSTSKGSSVEIPSGVISKDTQVSVSDIAEPSPEFKSGTKSASNGTLVTFTNGETLESAQLSIDSVIQLSDQIGENDLITVKVPLENSSTISNSPSAIVGISNGDREAKFIAPMEKTGSTAETVIPSSILGINNGSNSTAVSTTPFVLNEKSFPISEINEGIYNTNFNQVEPTDIKDSTIPIILIHGYKIARVDEVVIKEDESGSSIKESSDYLENWNSFINYAQENLLDLSS
ncbi:PKD domain-containing protein, partial [Candidatus Bipolaricaulota bacterium]|nr:PKD domain-containing protein [Candidatus Bipolaricaulota bacterium]